MNRKLFLVVAMAIVLPAQAYASDAGRNTSTQPATCGCHGGISAEVTTTITGLSTILAGTTQTYTASMTQALVGAGLNVALTGLGGASLGDIEANTKIIVGSAKAPAPYASANQITHTAAIAENTGDWSYDFTLTAPLTLGTIVLNAVMVAFDGDGSDAGDLTANVAFSVQVVPEPSTILLLGAGMAGLAALGRRRL